MKACNLIKGKIHSIETFGTVDGPGIRLVVFMQGCPMRCKYCHNPDTWNLNSSKELSPEEIITLFNKNKVYYKNGGITLSGGEPLLQSEFAAKVFELAKKQNIHTALDTSGILYNPEKPDEYDHLLKFTDLVMLDIKHINPEAHKSLCGYSNENVLAFAKYLSDIKKDLLVRHVVVPTLTDNPQDLFSLGEFIGTLSSVKSIEILPYHTMGVTKYNQMNIPYPLKDIPPLTKAELKKAEQIISDGIKKVLFS